MAESDSYLEVFRIRSCEVDLRRIVTVESIMHFLRVGSFPKIGIETLRVWRV